VSQSFTMPATAFESLQSARNLVHKQLIGDRVHATEIFTGPRRADVHAAMDARKGEIEAAGGAVFHRTSIGRNTPCPCGSGLKFKKCCIGKAALGGV
jgi:uncharacterized protein YecA (UPF0149 family)